MPFANTCFHAVGQGCFYSVEIFCAPESVPLRMVYDCGSETAGDGLKREISSFHRLVHDAKLDMLVLSHLDADHVNGLSLLLDNGFTAKNVFLPYLTPAQRVMAAAGADSETDPNYFELLGDPIGFLEGRRVENIIFVSGSDDEQENSKDQTVSPFEPAGDNGNSPNLEDLENDAKRDLHFYKGEQSNSTAKRGQLFQGTLLPDAPLPEPASDSRLPQKAKLHFKTDRKPFRLNHCWKGKFLHRDDICSVVNRICSDLDFTIRDGDPTSVQRYKRFLQEVHGYFGTLDPGRLVAAIRDKSDRKKLRNAYRHICGNHNDVSLVLWHGPSKMEAPARLRSSERARRRGQIAAIATCNGGTLLAGDLTCTNQTVDKMKRHFGKWLRESAFFGAPHHGSLHSWNPKLLEVTRPDVIWVISAGIRNGHHHPDPQVIDSLDNTNGGVRWFVNDERNPIAMRIETI